LRNQRFSEKFEKVADLYAVFDDYIIFLESGTKLVLKLKWGNFKRGGRNVKKFDYSLNLDIIFDTTCCVITEVDEGANLFLGNFYYHKNIEEKSKEVANQLLKEFMTHIKDKMAE